MNWTDLADDKPPQMAPGRKRVQVTQCMRKRKNGDEFRSASGPYLMVVFADDDGYEGTALYTLTEKAQWKLARDLSRLGVDLEALDKQGVSLSDFEDEDTASKIMVGKSADANVTDGGKYVDIELLATRRDEAGADRPSETTPAEAGPPGDGWAPVDESDSLPF